MNGIDVTDERAERERKLKREPQPEGVVRNLHVCATGNRKSLMREENGDLLGRIEPESDGLPLGRLRRWRLLPQKPHIPLGDPFAEKFSRAYGPKVEATYQLTDEGVDDPEPAEEDVLPPWNPEGPMPDLAEVEHRLYLAQQRKGRGKL